MEENSINSMETNNVKDQLVDENKGRATSPQDLELNGNQIPSEQSMQIEENLIVQEDSTVQIDTNQSITTDANPIIEVN